jgi:acyl-CoA synthetase (AMP-forming)/AMP-acid ligase II
MHPAVPEAEAARVIGSMEVRAVVAAAEDHAVHGKGVETVRLSAVRRDGRDGRAFTAPDNVQDGAPALVLLTSGSTGSPKGVVISHGNAWANLRSTVSAFRSDTDPSPLPTTGRPPNLIANPLSHTGGAVRLLFGLYVGRGVVLLRKFNAAAAKAAIDRHRIDNLTINPSMIGILLEDLPPRADLGAVRYVSSGTAPLPQALRERFEARFGVPVLQAYGQTEAFGAVTIGSVKDVLSGRRRPGSVGRALPGVTLRVVAGDGTDVVPGAEGEVWVRTAASTSGYLGEEASPVDLEGWLRTGDLGRQDGEGYLYITGRKKNVMICGGFNIVPEELEAALMADPEVRDVAVVPVPDDRLGEIPVALVEGVEAGADGAAILGRVRDRVTPYKRPRRLFVVTALPRVPAGKVDRMAATRLAMSLCDDPT